MQKDNRLPGKRTMNEDPQYFGAFLNMARQNVFLIINDLIARFPHNQFKDLDGEEYISNENFVNRAFIHNKKGNANHIFSHLCFQMPLVKVFSSDLLPASEKDSPAFVQNGLDLQDMGNSLKVCFNELNKFRNDYSHYYLVSKMTDRKKLVSEELAVFLRKNFERAISYTKKRFEGVFEGSDFRLAEKIELVSPDNIITQYGLVFFICLFLDRENAFLFFNRVVGLKGTQVFFNETDGGAQTDRSFPATREVFSAFCLRLPRDRFVSDNEDQAFILDVLNELQKCPPELYHNLNAENKKLFQPHVEGDRAKIQNILSNSVGKNEIHPGEYDAYIENITAKIRKTDRFTYMALRYLDEADTFKPLFQLNLGKAIVKSYPKNDRERQIVEEKKVFDNLKNYQNLDNPNFENIFDAKGNPQFSVLNFAPRYHVEQNKIGIYFSDNPKYYVHHREITAFISVHELPKILLLELLEKGAPTIVIGEFLKKSKNEILNRETIEEIKQRLGFEKPFRRKFQKKDIAAYTEAEMEDLKERRKKLAVILTELKLTVNQIPGRIIDYLLNIRDVHAAVSFKNRVKAHKKECSDRLKDLSKGKAPKVGEMATFLARDIVDLVIDKNVKQKITSFYYDQIQETLALYASEEKRLEFSELVGRQLGLLNKQTGHPFLSELDFGKIRNTKDLYENYLNVKGVRTKKTERYGKLVSEETNWLYCTFYKRKINAETKKMETVIDFPADKPVPLSYIKMKEARSDFDSWFSNVTEGKVRETDGKTLKDKPRPVDLPVDIFDAKLEELLRRKLEEENIEYKAENKWSKLLSQWINESQPFYNSAREYHVYDYPVRFKPGDKLHYKDYFAEAVEKVTSRLRNERRMESNLKNMRMPDIRKKNVLKVFNDAISANEKVIRFFQTKDRVLLLLLKELIRSEHAESDFNLSLHEFYPGSPASPLNAEIQVSQTINVKGKVLKINDRRKSKDFGALKRFVNDRRLMSLIPWLGEIKEISFQALNVELKEYNRYKELILDLVFVLEKAIIEKIIELGEFDEAVRSESEPNVDNVVFRIYLNWLTGKGFVDESKKGFLENVRGKYSHNEFPEIEKMPTSIEFSSKISLSEQVFFAFSEEVEDLKIKIGSLKKMG